MSNFEFKPSRFFSFKEYCIWRTAFSNAKIGGRDPPGIPSSVGQNLGLGVPYTKTRRSKRDWRANFLLCTYLVCLPSRLELLYHKYSVMEIIQMWSVKWKLNSNCYDGLFLFHKLYRQTIFEEKFSHPMGMQGCVNRSYLEWQAFRMTSIQNDKYLEWQAFGMTSIQNDKNSGR